MKPTPEQDDLASFFFALGHRRRQMLCAILRDAGETGMTFGTLQIHSGLNAATLSHHLGFMDKGRILRRRARKTETWISLDSGFLAKAAIHFGECFVRFPEKAGRIGGMA